METMKSLTVKSLIETLQTKGWTNAQFWEAKAILDCTPDADMDENLVELMFLWGDVEADRISCGEHDNPSPETEMYLADKWPVTPTHNGRFWA